MAISNRYGKRSQRSSILVALLLLAMLIVPIPVWAAVSVDTDGFNPYITPYLADVNDIELQPDGKILIGGDFDGVEGIASHRIARLNADGSLDDSFVHHYFSIGHSNVVNSLALQSDGKIIIGGHFFYYTYEPDLTPHQNIVRLNADGSHDTSFNAGAFEDYESVNTLVLQSDGKMLIGGDFRRIDGEPRNYLASTTMHKYLAVGLTSNPSSRRRPGSIESTTYTLTHMDSQGYRT